MDTAGMLRKPTWLQQMAATLPPKTGGFVQTRRQGEPTSYWLCPLFQVSEGSSLLVLRQNPIVKSAFMKATGLTPSDRRLFARATILMY